MAVASAPTVISTSTLAAWKISSATGGANSNPVTHIGMTYVNPGDNTTIPLGGLIDVWYCRATHGMFIDIVDAQQGGPV
jgi:hypothetical protein